MESVAKSIALKTTKSHVRPKSPFLRPFRVGLIRWPPRKYLDTNHCRGIRSQHGGDFSRLIYNTKSGIGFDQAVQSPERVVV